MSMQMSTQMSTQETVAGGGWDVVPAGVLVIGLGIAVMTGAAWWWPVGIFAVGVGSGALVVVAFRGLRRQAR